ncbi:isochorismatase family protein [Deinococcus cellulosilyticus]|uniref:Hydrolase n=1 Tax=Deinococcus cellulosilyticus (strain DSM 18568 / NBRC 106333 / KACC 11606 / 5516J-15) TaxID=1223518 RepID=A0A511N7N0_DEIC1|nr:isochorismatase family protein [Deinococcus cellulosilyticus]GEM48421.1 hydrolase [Deinococcus cellulosilyticus NBRC 106333 = KACC 11606]
MKNLKVLSLSFLLTVPAALAQTAPGNPEVISPVQDGVLLPETGAQAAREAGRFVYDKPTPENTIFLFIDHQVGLVSGIRDFTSLAEYRNNVVGLAKIAKALNIPVLLTSSNAQWQNGDTLPELRQIFPNETIYRRTGIINAYEDPTFRKALQDMVQKTGRRHIVISGVTLGTCVSFPTLSMLQDGYRVYPVVDASGAWSRYEAEVAMQRMTRAGAELHSVFALGAELQADWKKPSATAMLAPFRENLPEYGLVLDNFWNNYGQKVVPDPFKP